MTLTFEQMVTTASLRIDTELLTGVTAGTILILEASTFSPILALGSIAEAFQLATRHQLWRLPDGV